MTDPSNAAASSPNLPDPSVDELAGASTRAIAEVVRQVLSAEGIRWVKCEVTGSVTDEDRRFVYLRRPENDVADAKPYPVLGYWDPPWVGQWVHCLETPGGLFVIGGEQWSNDWEKTDLQTVYNDYYGHNHDSRYYTMGESDGRYYTKTFINANVSWDGHTHSQYATDGHTHPQYANDSHGHNYASTGHGHDSGDLPSSIVYASELRQDADGYLKWA